MTLIAWLAIVIAPLSLGAAAFLWQLHALDRVSTGPAPRLRLSLVLALTGSIAALAAIWLAAIAFFMLLDRADLARSLGWVTVLALFVLDVIPIVNAAYLRWLRSRS